MEKLLHFYDSKQSAHFLLLMFEDLIAVPFTYLLTHLLGENVLFLAAHKL